MAQLACNRTQWRFHHEIWHLAGNRTSIAGISPDLVALLQQDWIEQITRAIPAQLLILDPFGCVIVTLSHGLSMAPASIPRPVRPSLMKPCLGNLKNLLRISIIRGLATLDGDRLQLLGTHDGPHAQPGGMMIEIMTNVCVSD